MHRKWCGKPCCDCNGPCALDELIPCSLDCEYLGPKGHFKVIYYAVFG